MRKEKTHHNMCDISNLQHSPTSRKSVPNDDGMCWNDCDYFITYYYYCCLFVTYCVFLIRYISVISNLNYCYHAVCWQGLVKNINICNNNMPMVKNYCVERVDFWISIYKKFFDPDNLMYLHRYIGFY